MSAGLTDEELQRIEAEWTPTYLGDETREVMLALISEVRRLRGQGRALHSINKALAGELRASGCPQGHRLCDSALHSINEMLATCDAKQGAKAVSVFPEDWCETCRAPTLQLGTDGDVYDGPCHCTLRAELTGLRAALRLPSPHR